MYKHTKLTFTKPYEAKEKDIIKRIRERVWYLSVDSPNFGMGPTSPNFSQEQASVRLSHHTPSLLRGCLPHLKT